MAAPVAPVLSGTAVPAAPDATAIRPVVTEALGLERTAVGLARAVAALLPQALRAGDPGQGPASLGLILAVAALQRAESRGAHCRSDAPRPLAGPPVRSFLTLAGALESAGNLAAHPVARSA
jgi:L-aspartate oxidase